MILNKNFYMGRALDNRIGGFMIAEVARLLKENKVNVAIFYPQPLHTQECFEYLGYKKGDLPVTEKVCNTIFNLPCYGEITREEQDYIINVVQNNKLILDS